MQKITVSFPDPKIHDFVTRVVASGSFTSPDEYLMSLIKEDRKRRAKAKLELLLLEGLEGEWKQFNDKDWDEMLQRYDDRNNRSS